MQITTLFSENDPSQTEKFKSRRFEISISREVPDNTDVMAVSHDYFQLARASVRAEIERSKGDQAFSGIRDTKEPRFHNIQASSNGQNGTRSATARQLDYVKAMGRKAGLTLEQIGQLPRQYFGQSLESLNSSQASSLISVLKEKKLAA